MAIVQTLTKSDFVQAFKQSSRKDQFSHEALEAIFEYLEDYSNETGENVELDIVAICCEWAEMSWNEIATSYDVDLSQCTDNDERIGEVEDYLSKNTQYLEIGEGSFVFVQF
jgi:type I site-specific restriction endonuclease